MNLQSNDFELFGLPERFAQDRAALDARWKELQREAHPDKFRRAGRCRAARGHAMVGAHQRGLPAPEGPAQARGLPVRAARRADRTPKTTRRCRQSS